MSVIDNISKSAGQQRQFSIILYPDSDVYDWVSNPYGADYFYKRLESWIEKNRSRLSHWAYVTHLNDVDVLGQPIKPHVHLGLCFDNNHSSSVKALYDEFSLNSSSHIICKGMGNWNWNNWQALTEYYNHDDVVGKVPAFSTYHSDTPYIDKASSKRSKAQVKRRAREQQQHEECQQASDIIAYIESVKGYIGITDLTKWVISEGLYSTFRRNASVFRSIVAEHNIDFDRIKRLKKSLSLELNFESPKDDYEQIEIS